MKPSEQQPLDPKDFEARERFEKAQKRSGTRQEMLQKVTGGIALLEQAFAENEETDGNARVEALSTLNPKLGDFFKYLQKSGFVADKATFEALTDNELVARLKELVADLQQIESGVYEVKTAVTATVPEAALSLEQAELLGTLEKQYPQMRATLEKYEIPTTGMPTWEQIKKGLTPEVLEKSLKLQEPSLLLIPPTTRKSKVETINKHPAKGQKYDTATYKLEDNDLWNGGKTKTEAKWKVSIVEGVQDVEPDPAINNGEKTNYQMATEWVKKLEAQGLDVLEGADAYLILMMKGLAEGKPIDEKYWTALNAKNLTKSSLVARGFWNYVRVYLSVGIPDVIINDLRLRGSVGVDVPQA